MKKLRFMLWLAMILPWSWWRAIIWKLYFEKRVETIEFLPSKEVAMKSIDQLITVYISESADMTFEELARLAVLQDEEAAESFKASVETQLQIERAAAICRLN